MTVQGDGPVRATVQAFPHRLFRRENFMNTSKPQIGGEVTVPGHEKTINRLQAIISGYRMGCFDSNGKYNFNQNRQDVAVDQIMGLSQFYTRSNALKMLGGAVSSPPQPTPPAKKPRGNQKSP
jgi:hypothetical protein